MKLKLTKEQVDILVKHETDLLKLEFEKKVVQLKKKYEFVEVDIHTDRKQNQRKRLTDEALKTYLKEGKSIKEVAELTGYNRSYLSKRKKQIMK